MKTRENFSSSTYRRIYNIRYLVATKKYRATDPWKQKEAKFFPLYVPGTRCRKAVIKHTPTRYWHRKKEITAKIISESSFSGKGVDKIIIIARSQPSPPIPANSNVLRALYIH